MSRFGKGLKTISSASCTGGKNKSNDVQKEKEKRCTAKKGTAKNQKTTKKVKRKILIKKQEDINKWLLKIELKQQQN